MSTENIIDCITVYCSKCFEKLDKNGFLLLCEHFLCGTCIGDRSNPQCFICDKTVESVPLSNLPTEVEFYFKSPSQALHLLGNIWFFQSNHQISTINLMKRKLDFNEAEIKSRDNRIEQLKVELLNEKENVKRAKIARGFLVKESFPNNGSIVNNDNDDFYPAASGVFSNVESKAGLKRPKNIVEDIKNYFRCQDKSFNGSDNRILVSPSFDKVSSHVSSEKKFPLVRQDRLLKPTQESSKSNRFSRPITPLTPTGVFPTPSTVVSPTKCSPSRLRSPQLLYPSNRNFPQIRESAAYPLLRNRSRSNIHPYSLHDSYMGAYRNSDTGDRIHTPSRPQLGLGAMKSIGVPQSRGNTQSTR